METISTTKLARKYSLNNRELETKLRELGIEPVQAIEMSGRRFATWDRKLAESKLKEFSGTARGSNMNPIKEDIFEIKQVLRKIETMLKKNTESV